MMPSLVGPLWPFRECPSIIPGRAKVRVRPGNSKLGGVACGGVSPWFGKTNPGPTTICAKISGIKEKPRRRGRYTGLLRFLVGEPVMGREKPITPA